MRKSLTTHWSGTLATLAPLSVRRQVAMGKMENQSVLQAVLFDFDFTLADPSAGTVECVNYALTSLGWPEASPQQIRETIGLSPVGTLQFLTGETNPAAATEFGRLFRDRADHIMVPRAVVYDTVRPTLAALRAFRLSLGIVSTKRRRHIAGILARSQLLDHFDNIIGGEDVATYKPDPEGLQLALSRLGVDPGVALYVGDHPVDSETAQRAGVRFVAVLSGTSTCDSFQGQPVLAFLNDLRELPSVLRGRGLVVS